MGYYFESTMADESKEMGIVALKKIKEMYPEAHVVMMSREEELIIKSKALRFGAQEVLIKNELIDLRISNLVHKIISYKRLDFLRHRVYSVSWIFLAYLAIASLIVYFFSKIQS